MNALTQLGFSSAPLLTVIQAGDFASLADLAAKAGRDKRNISRDLTTLEEAGLVVRTEPSKPTLTPAGVDQLAAVDRANAPVVLHDQIEADPLNPRRVFHDEALTALADSIYDDGKLTLLQPLVIRPREGGPKPFRLVAGERRWRAIGRLIADGRWPAELPVPTSIRALSDEEAAILALVENMQREDLSAVDEALTFEHLAETLGWSNADIAKHIKRTPEYVQQRRRVLKLPEEIQSRMRLPKSDENRIGFKEARKMFTVSKEPARPKAPELSPKLALALLELAHRIEAAPMTLNGEVGFTVLAQRPTGGALATLNERKVVVLREWGGQVFAKIQLYTSGAVTYLEDVGFYGPKRDEVIWAARTAIMSPQRASEATRGGRYITPELNTELVAEEPVAGEADDAVEEETGSSAETADVSAPNPLSKAVYFTDEVQKAALAAYRAADARDANARFGKVAGTTTIEGEAWPEGVTEELATTWKEYPRVKFMLTKSSKDRWFVSISTQQGGPGYGGQGSPWHVYTNDPLFLTRGDALAYAVARATNQLQEWGTKRNIREWFAGVLAQDQLQSSRTPEAALILEKAARKPKLSPKAILFLAEILVASERRPSQHFNFSPFPVADVDWSIYQREESRTGISATTGLHSAMIDKDAPGAPAGVYLNDVGRARLLLDGLISRREDLGDSAWLYGLRRDAGLTSEQASALRKTGKFYFENLNVQAALPSETNPVRPEAQRALDQRMAEVRSEMAETNPVRDQAARSPSIFARDQPAEIVSEMIDRPASALVTLASSVTGQVITFAAMSEDDGRSICSSLVESGLWLSVTIHDRAGKLLVAWG